MSEASKTEWFDPAEKLPEDGQECLLMPHDDGGLVTVGVHGPITYRADLKAWCDLFSSRESGTIVAAADVGCWTDWGPLEPPDHLPTPWPKGKS
jgi:hypothetical protein